MDKFNFINDLSKKLSESLPKNFQILKEDMEKNFHTVLKNAFNKMDLVTREEFDAQTKVLARTRKKLEELEIKLKEMEEAKHK